MSAATPRPWRASTRRTFADRGGYIDFVSDPHGKLELVGENMRPDDAALIVRAVNSHEALVQACEAGLARIVDAHRAAGIASHAIEKQIESAIALAKGGGS